MITPATLDPRAVAIEKEAENIVNGMCTAHLQAARCNRAGRFIGISTIVKHAREVSTNAYDAARERERAEQVATRARQAAE